MRILITGSSGRIGRSLYAELVSRGHDVVGIDLSTQTSTCDIEADVSNAAEVYSLVARAKPEAIVHLAGLPVPFSRPEHILFNLNVSATFNVCQAAADLAVKIVLCASSPTVIGYGNPAGWAPSYLPIDEAHPIAPWHAYAMSKAAVEQVVRGFAAQKGNAGKFFAFRPCYVVAPEDWAAGAPTLLGHTMVDRLRNPALAAVSLFNYVDARDVARFAAMVCEHGATLPNGECFFISAPDALATAPLSELLPRYNPAAGPLASSLVGSQAAFNTAKATMLLGWKPQHSWRTELKEAM